MLKNIGWPELAVIILVVLFLFGGNIIPRIGKLIGESTKEFKDAAKDLKDSTKKD